MADPGSGNGERKHPRHDAVFRVSYQNVHLLVDYTENVSEEGVFIATEEKFETGSSILFELSFPTLIKPIRLSGEVIWCRTSGSLNEVRPPGIGVRIRFDNDVERRWLRDLLRKLTADGQGAPPVQGRSSYVVLLAEDNEVSRSMFLGALSQKASGAGEPEAVKMKFLETDDTFRTWETLCEQKVDLLIIEWRLCMEGSVHILERMRSEPGMESTAVLVLGSTREEEREALEAGADVFLRRPFPAKGLIRTVRSLMSEKARTGRRT